MHVFCLSLLTSLRELLVGGWVGGWVGRTTAMLHWDLWTLFCRSSETSLREVLVRMGTTVWRKARNCWASFLSLK